MAPPAPSAITNRRPILVFMLVACGFSWGLWLLMIASARGYLPFRFPANPLGSFGPTLAALLLVRRAGLHTSVGTFLRESLTQRVAARWIAAALLLPIALTGAAILAHRLAAGALPPLQALDRVYLLPAVFVLILVLGGPGGEEFGWRGYVLPLLLRRWTPVAASLLLAALWLLWHLPLFWLEGAAQEGGSIVVFGLTVAAASVLFTWVYLHTAPSLVGVLLLHTSINVGGFVLPTVLPGVADTTPFTVGLVSAFVLTAALVTAADHRMRARR